LFLLAHYINPLPGAAPIRLDAIGKCIYCGNEDGPLDREHIIPESMGGGLILPRATCPCGPKRTHGFEGKVVNQVFQETRRQLGIRGKKRKRTADELLLSVQEGFADPFNLATTRKVEIKDHPSMLIIPRIRPLPMLGTSQLLSEVDGQIIPFDFWNLVPDDRERIDRLKQQGAKGVWRLVGRPRHDSGKSAGCGSGPQAVMVPSVNQLAAGGVPRAAWGGSFVPRYALVSQTALVGRPIHQGTAFFTGYVIRGGFGHGDFVFGAAVAFMRAGKPLYEFGHAWDMRLSRSRSTPLRLGVIRDVGPSKQKAHRPPQRQRLRPRTLKR
jgi:hypothetical protein